MSSAILPSSLPSEALPSHDALLEQLRTREKEVQLLKEVGQTMASQTELQPLLDLVANKARDLIQAESILIPMLNKERTHYQYRAASGKNAELILGQKFLVRIGMCGWVLTKEIPLLFGEGSEWLMDQKTQWEAGMQSALLVPLLSRGKIVGGISGMGKLGKLSFSQEDLETLMLFANQISTTIDNMQIMEEMAQQTSRIQVTLDSIADGVVTTDRKGKVEYLNPVAEEMTGWRNADARGKPIEAIVPLHDESSRNPVPSLIRHSLEAGNAIETTLHRLLINKNGGEFAVTESAAPIHNPEQQIIGTILVIHDVTETRELNQQLSYQSYQAGLVEMSTTILHNIGNAINGISVRANSMSKDIKEITMIGSILMQQKEKLRQLASAHPELSASSELSQFLDISEEAAKTLAQIVSTNLHPKTTDIFKGIEHIIEIVRSQQKIACPSLQSEFHLEQAIRDAFSIQHDALIRHGIEFQISLDLAIDVVHLPKNPFIQMLMNLIKNAIEAIEHRRKTQPGPGFIQVRGSMSAEGQFVHLEFLDDGCGIEADSTQRLFQYGYSSKNRGSGFGLHSVATFVQSQGGEIQVQSKGQNQGTRFSLKFPVNLSESNEPLRVEPT